jgi:hypothetical protein
MALRFAGGRTDVDPQISLDIQSLNAFNVEQLGHFTDLIIAFMLAPQSTNLMETVGTFAASHGVNPKALRNSIRGILLFLKGSLKYNLNQALVKADLQTLGMSDQHADVIVGRWEQNLLGLSVSMGQTVMANQLVDMEWKFGVTASSSDLKAVGSTFLQLKLVIDKGAGVTEDVHMELTLPQFYEFLASMEKAKTHLDYLSQ